MQTYFVVTLLAVAAASLVRRASSPGGLSERRPSGADAAMGTIVWLILVGVAAFRWRVGVDYVQYVELYEYSYNSADLGAIRLWEEPGIVALSKAGAVFYDDYATMFALASLITVGLTVRVLYRNSAHFGYAVLLYIITTSWQGSFNGVRQYLACAILFAGHQMIVRRQLIRYVLVVGIAALFHISAVIAILLYWVPRSRMGWMRTALLILLAVGAVTAYDLLGDVFSWVKQDDISEGSYFSEQVNSLRILVAFAPIALFALFTDKKRLSPSEYFWINLTLVNAAILLASSGSAYVARFSIYTGVYLPLALPAIWRIPNSSLRALVIGATVVGYSVFWYLETSIEPSLYNFNWIFQR